MSVFNHSQAEVGALTLPFPFSSLVARLSWPAVGAGVLVVTEVVQSANHVRRC